MLKLPFQSASRSLRLAAGGVLSLACSLALSGCGSVNGSSTSIAQLRIIDATPKSGGIDIYANDTALAYNLGFGTVTSYVPTAPATYTLAAEQAGTHTVLTSTRTTIQSQTQYTLLLSNVAGSLQGQVLTDQSQPAPSGQVALRFLDEVTSSGAVDVYLVPQGSKLSSVGPMAPGLVSGADTGYLNVPGGTYTLYVVRGGAVISSSTVPLYTGSSTNLPAGSARTIVLLNQQLLTNPGVQVIVANDYDSASEVSP